MDSRGFPFNKLIKVILIITLVTLPIAFYYYLHINQQTDYLNQRNFRALNEIILQYENNFEALSNLFKFPPPKDPDKYDIEKNHTDLKQQLYLMQNNAEFNKDTQFRKWIDARFRSISANKNSLIKLEEKIQITKNYYIDLLTPLTQKNDCIEYISQINHLDHKIDELKILQRILKNKGAINRYQSRLRLNKSLGDIIVTTPQKHTLKKRKAEEKEPKTPCFSRNKVIFTINSDQKPAKVDSSACRYTYTTSIPALLGNIRHDEFDVIILADQSGKVLFAKELRGVAIFAKACFGHPSPSKRQKLNATAMPSAPRFVLVTTSRPNRGSEHWLQMT